MRGNFWKRHPRYVVTLFLVAASVACNSATSLPTLKPGITDLPTAASSDTSKPVLLTESPTVTLAKTKTITSAPPSATSSPAPSPSASPTPIPLRFAVIGDYGTGDPYEAAVAELVKSWNPELIITTGDNNYDYGEAETIDINIGQFYHTFIYPYQGAYGEGADTNRFFPSLGNHDWLTLDGDGMPFPYLDYFKLPQRESGNERYYDFVWGPVHFFALDSDSHEPDGVGRSSVQAAWLQSRLNESSSPWKLVYAHHPPYSSGYHGSIEWMRWPYAEWGATAFLGGHDHLYERLVIEGFPYFINGMGGASIYYFNTPLAGSEVRYDGDHGAMLVEASESSITFQFISVTGEVIDIYTIGTEPESEAYLFLPLVRFATMDRANQEFIRTASIK